MASNNAHDVVLVADIGGTNARFACFDLHQQQLLSRCTLPVSDYRNIDEALDSAGQTLPEFDDATVACVAIAGPVTGDWVQASNSTWAFSRKDLQARYAWSLLLVINDFLAAAYGTLLLEPRDYRRVGEPEPGLQGASPAVVIGPGTGLGVAALIPGSGSARWRGFATEGGHARLGPDDDEDIALLKILQQQLGSVQREDVLSGRGLCNLHRAWMTLQGKEAEPITDPARITAEALRNSASNEAEVLNRFCGILGVVAADVALDFAAWEGVYLAGGILPRVEDFFMASPFRKRFDTHPQFAERLRPIPTALITEDTLGLLGAAQYLQQNLHHANQK